MNTNGSTRAASAISVPLVLLRARAMLLDRVERTLLSACGQHDAVNADKSVRSTRGNVAILETANHNVWIDKL